MRIARCGGLDPAVEIWSDASVLRTFDGVSDQFLDWEDRKNRHQSTYASLIETQSGKGSTAVMDSSLDIGLS